MSRPSPLSARKRSSRPAPKARDRAATERALLAAIGQILSRRGPAALGVNAVAAEAGLDKVLLYRYFGGLRGALEAYAASSAFWPTREELVGDLPELLAVPVEEAVSSVLARYVAALRRRPATLAILAGEIGGHASIHVPLEKAREAMGTALIELVRGRLAPGVDLPALSAILTGGIHYLLLRARDVAVFNGVSLRTSAGRRRLEAALRALVRGAVSPSLEGASTEGASRRPKGRTAAAPASGRPRGS